MPANPWTADKVKKVSKHIDKKHELLEEKFGSQK